MNKKGLDYEKFVNDIFKSFYHKLGRKILTFSRNIKILGKSNAQHEIDVYFECLINGKKQKIAIECKDYNSTISKGKVTEFYGKLLDLKNVFGIIATKKGFQKGAIQYAKHYGIELVLVKNAAVEDFPSGSILNYEIQIEILSHIFRNFTPEFDKKWMLENGFKKGEKYQIFGNGDTLVIQDEKSKFEGTLNDFINKNENSIYIESLLSKEDESLIVWNFEEAFLIDLLNSNKKYKIKSFSLYVKRIVQSEKIDINVLNAIDGIIKKIEDGTILHVKYKDKG